MSKVDSVKDIISSAGSSFVSVKFVKKSTGEERTVLFNPYEDKKENKLKSGNNAAATAKRKKDNPNIFAVIDKTIADREKDRNKGWRTFDCNNVIEIKVKGKTYSFN